MTKGTGQSILCGDNARETLEAADTVERLYRVAAPHFHAGILVRQGSVVEAAPILRWALGQRWVDVLATCNEQGWRMDLVLRPVIEPAWLRAKRLLEEIG